ncbi:MAG: phage integrase SAM-like domain-containing protein [bacterium]|jgi:integrase|nr:phage integrase SAM-like domain-containing protein [bacterium]
MALNPAIQEPLFVSTCENILINTFFDARRIKKNGLYTIYVRVNCHHQRLLLPTGVSLSDDDYAAALQVKAGSSAIRKARAQVGQLFNKVVDAVNALNAENKFSFENLKSALASPQQKQSQKSTTLYEYWVQFGESKNTQKTREQYSNALKNFYRYLGCTVTTVTDEATKVKSLVIKGKKSKLLPSFVNEAVIEEWQDYMTKQGLSDSSKSIYLRALRAVLNSLGEKKIIGQTPKFNIKSGTRRKEDFIPVSDIIKIRDYEGRNRKAADWWLILYLCNGSNMKDIAKLVWDDDFFYKNELSYVRGKIADKVKVTVHIPITEPLKQLLDKYATEPEKGRRVFPQILLNATTEAEIESRTHDFNRQIRKGMQYVCKQLGISPVTASTARNSYITTLTWHNISDAFIDAMVGHVDSKNVLRGYQGTISPKKRLKVNNLLFVDPEIDEDEE